MSSVQEIIRIIFYPEYINQENGSVLKSLKIFFTLMVKVQAGKIVIKESHGTKSEDLFHALCHHKQIDTLYAGKDA